jgi:antitoxin component of MazEF toxin-antitoxin module
LALVITCDNIVPMAAVKLQKIGNSYGFRIPKDSLKHAGFRAADRYELIEEDGVIVIVKAPVPTQKWAFKDAVLTDEDRRWVEADLGEATRRKRSQSRK